MGPHDSEPTVTSHDDRRHQQERTEIVGQLTCGVAHDINNLLMVITANVDLLASDPSLHLSDRSEVADLRTACGRAAALTRRLLAFTRRDAVKLELLDVKARIAGLAEFLRRLFRSHVTIALQSDQCPYRAFIDAMEFDQVFLNLTVNARDAMPNGGTITIDSGHVCVEGCASPSGYVRGTMRPGPHVRVAVQDTGAGIPEDTLPRIFDPYFTTKAPGEGTGLGLSTVLHIVEGWGGHVVVRSRPGEGSTFEVFIPVGGAE